MGKLKYIVLVCALLVVSSAKAYVKVAIDPWAIGQVTANTASQTLIENQHMSGLTPSMPSSRRSCSTRLPCRP